MKGLVEEMFAPWTLPYYAVSFSWASGIVAAAIDTWWMWVIGLIVLLLSYGFTKVNEVASFDALTQLVVEKNRLTDKVLYLSCGLTQGIQIEPAPEGWSGNVLDAPDWVKDFIQHEGVWYFSNKRLSSIQEPQNTHA